jgi:chromosome condensin MukBEF ATPase and DNA-binding subunit MukB
MTTIETIKAEINEQMNHAQMITDEIKLQLTLGEAELNDSIIAKRKEASAAAAELSDYLTDIGASFGDVKDNILANVDNLKLQVALGKMDSKEVIIQAKTELTKSTDQFEKALESTKSIQTEKVEQVKNKISDYMNKVSSLKASIEAKIENLAD